MKKTLTLQLPDRVATLEIDEREETIVIELTLGGTQPFEHRKLLEAWVAKHIAIYMNDRRPLVLIDRRDPNDPRSHWVVRPETFN